jgi:hypothetical protein
VFDGSGREYPLRGVVRTQPWNESVQQPGRFDAGAEVNSVVLRLDVEFPRTIFGGRREGIHRLDVTGRSDATQVLPEHANILVRSRRGVQQDQLGQPFGMTARVLHRQHCAPAVPKDRHHLQSEVASHVVHVLHFRRHRHIAGAHAVSRPPSAALVVVNDEDQ